MSTDEAVLAFLAERRLSSSAEIGAALGLLERTARRRLRRLIKDGYVFAPERGRYRLTAAGLAVLAEPNLPKPEEAAPRLLEATPRDIVDRWRARR